MKKLGTLLDRMIEQGFSIAELEKAATTTAGYGELIQLVLDSPQVLAEAKRPWDFKSVAQVALEDFILKEHSPSRSDKQWLKMLEFRYSSWLQGHCFWEEEGLLFYVRDGNGYRRATKGDDAYDLVRGLINEQMVLDSRWSSPPKWARGLFFNRHNYEAHQLLSKRDTFQEFNNPTQPRKTALFALSVAFLTDHLGEREELLPGARDGLFSLQQEEVPLSTRQRNTFLKLILGMAVAYYGYEPSASRSTVVNEIVSDLANVDFDVSDDTVRKIIKDAVEVHGQSLASLQRSRIRKRDA